MANSLGSLRGSMTLESAAFIRNLGRATRAIESNTAQMNKHLRKVSTASRQMAREMQTVRRAATGAGAALAAIGLGVVLRDTARTSAEFQRLQASLRTVTGGTRHAEAAFRTIKQFAATTPFDLQQVTEAFIKLKALGLDPSAEALQSYGNTASSMGRSLNQMIEAVADAATGEFERLKEFGIRASSEGERVTFTFQNVSTTVGKNAREIEGFLRGLGEVQFAGAMEEQARTLGGALSNLGDSFSVIQNEVGEGGFADAIADVSREMSQSANSSHNLAREIGHVLGEAVRTTASAVKVIAANFREIAAAIAAIIALKAATIFIGIAAAVARYTAAVIAATRATAVMEALLSRSVVGLVAKIGVTLGAAALAWDALAKSTDEAKGAAAEYARQIKSDQAAVETAVELTREQAKAKLEEAVARREAMQAAIAERQAELQASRSNLQDLASQRPTGRLGPAQARAREMSALQDQIKAVTKELDGLSATTKENDDLIASLKERMVDLGKAAEATTTSTKSTTAAAQKYSDQLKIEIRQLKDLARFTELSEEAGKQMALTIEIENEIRAEGIALGTKEAETLGLLIEERERLKRQIEETTKARDEDAKAAEKAAEKLQEQARIQADLFAEPFKNAIRGIQDGFTDAFQKIFDGGVNSFSDLGDTIKGIFTRLAAEIASLLVFRPVVGEVLRGVGLNNIAAQLTGSTSSGIGAGVGGIDLSSIGAGATRVGQFFGIGGSSAAGSSAAIASDLGPFASTSAISAQSGAASGATAAAAAVPVWGWLALAASVAKQFTTGASKGSPLGILNTALGPSITEAFSDPLGSIGSGFNPGGQALVEALGGGKVAQAVINPIGLFNSFFGGDKVTKGTARANLTGGEFVPGRVTSERGQSTDAQSAAIQLATEAANTIIERIGGTFRDVSKGFAIAIRNGQLKVRTISNAPGAPGGTAFTDHVLGKPSEETFAEAINMLVSNVVTEFATGIDDPEIRNAFKKVRPESVDEINGIIGFVENLRALAKPVTEAVGPFATAMAQLDAEMEAARDTAKELGVNLKLIDDARKRQVEHLRTDFSTQVADSIRALVDPVGAAWDELIRAQQMRIDEAKALGITLAEVNRLNALEQQAFKDQQAALAAEAGSAFASAAQSIRAFREGLLTSDLSTLSPVAQLGAARDLFDSVVSNALTGDTDSLNRVNQVAQDFLTASQAVNASSAAFATDFNTVQAVLMRLENFAAAEGGIELDDLNETNVAGFSSVENALREEVGEMRRQIERLTDAVERAETLALTG